MRTDAGYSLPPGGVADHANGPEVSLFRLYTLRVFLRSHGRKRRRPHGDCGIGNKQTVRWIVGASGRPNHLGVAQMPCDSTHHLLDFRQWPWLVPPKEVADQHQHRSFSLRVSRLDPRYDAVAANDHEGRRFSPRLRVLGPSDPVLGLAGHLAFPAVRLRYGVDSLHAGSPDTQCNANIRIPPEDPVGS